MVAPSSTGVPKCPPPSPQDLENPVDAPVGWLHQGDAWDLVELSGEEDEAPRVAEGAGAPGRAGGVRGAAGVAVTVAVTVTLGLLRPQVPLTPQRRSG